MNIIITGVCGLIGSHLADELLIKGHQITGIDDLSFGNINNISEASKNNNFTFIKTDIRDYKALKWALNVKNPKLDFDVVFHLAAYKKAPKDSINSSDVMINNVEMIKNVSKFCEENNATLIFTSTSDIYGNSDNFLEDESITIGPPNIERYSYAMSKLFDEQLLLNLVSEKKIKCIIPRIFGCFSERSNDGWSGGHVPLFIDNALKDKDIIIHGDGHQTRSMCYVSDIVNGLIELLNNKDTLNGEIINIGSAEEMSILNCAKLIIELCNSNSRIQLIDNKKIFGEYKEIKRRFANTKKIQSLIGWKQQTKFTESLKKVIALKYAYLNKG
jgi:UDP-glucose 4-epimerase